MAHSKEINIWCFPSLVLSSEPAGGCAGGWWRRPELAWLWLRFSIRLLPISWLFTVPLSHTLSHSSQQILRSDIQQEIGLKCPHNNSVKTWCNKTHRSQSLAKVLPRLSPSKLHKEVDSGLMDCSHIYIWQILRHWPRDCFNPDSTGGRRIVWKKY